MKIYLMILFYFIPALFCFGEETLSEARKAYDKGLYDEALKSYNQTLLKTPDAPEILFNQGAVLYKQQKYEEALNLFQKALQSTDPGIQASAHYNMGNVYFRQQKWKESLASYKKAFELQPSNKDCKYNIEFVQKKIKDEQQKQEEKKQNPSSQGQEDKQKESGEASGSDQKNAQKNQGEKSESSEEQKQGQSGQEQNSGENPSGKQESSQGKPEENKAEKQEAQQTSEGQQDKSLEKGDLQKMADEKNKDEKNKGAAVSSKPEEKKEGELSKEEAARLLMTLDSQYNNKGRHSQLRIQDEEEQHEYKDYKDW